MIEKLSFFGLGKLGLPLAALFAANGDQDNEIDIDAALVSALEALAIQFTEPGLDNLLVSAGTFLVARQRRARLLRRKHPSFWYRRRLTRSIRSFPVLTLKKHVKHSVMS